MQLLPTGPLLGDLTREIPAGKVVKNAAFIAPKSYSYELRDEETGVTRAVVKCKGITLHTQALQLLSFRKILGMAKAYCLQSKQLRERIPQFRISSSAAQIVKNSTLSKVFQATSDKRLIVGNDTFPKGYVSNDGCVALNIDMFAQFLESQ